MSVANSSERQRLAIDGGRPVRTTPLPPWPVFSDEEIAAAADVLRSGRVNYWTGDVCETFESEFAAYCGVRRGISLANGTLALELALRALGIGPGDEVIVSPRSYFASASAIVLCGAEPVFADVDPDTQNVDAASIEGRITERTRAVMAVHLAGWPCDMPEIMRLAKDHELHVVEDCAQAHGAEISGKRIGSFGDVAAFSFCQDKIMTTGGEGGMLLTDRDDLWEQAWSYKDHGKSWSKVHSDEHAQGFRWLHDGFGSNWRLTEMQAAIGRVQLSHLAESVASRRANAARLIEGLSGISSLHIPEPVGSVRHAYYKFYMFVRPGHLKPSWNRDRILRAFEAEGIPGWSGSCPEIYKEQAFAGSNPHKELPVAARLGKTSIMLPVHPTLSTMDIDDMIEAVAKVMDAATA